MGTEVLRPQDPLADRFRSPPASFHRRRNFPGGGGSLTNLIVNRRPTYGAAHRKTSPRPEKKRSGAAADARRREDGSGLVMGQVTLLRRGESLDSFASKIGEGENSPPSRKPVDDMAVVETSRNGPARIRLSPPPIPDVYAGSAFSLSPSPRSLPLPSFFSNKKQQQQIDGGESRPSDDPATRDLRRLLRLD